MTGHGEHFVDVGSEAYFIEFGGADVAEDEGGEENFFDLPSLLAAFI